MAKVNIEYKGVPLTVSGIYTRPSGDGYITPFEEGGFEIDRVYANGVEITSLLSEEQIEEINEQIML